MRILLISDYFPPEIGSASHLFYELGKEFSRRGIEVTVVTGMPSYNVDKHTDPSKYSGRFVTTESVDGMTVKRIRKPGFSRSSYILRGVEQFIVAF